MILKRTRKLFQQKHVRKLLPFNVNLTALFKQGSKQDQKTQIYTHGSTSILLIILTIHVEERVNLKLVESSTSYNCD
ncbi:hypothetical protein T4E_11127 [Trichinella pseudospiralis]|uniref:Uncharacterized protein n=1 Tax=Trichinella pseudospiralis TaxID=6337 RepID=A0A0V0YH40_TRIPS|nr:hypothetical protein T4E_11127 [Trichinella pseudospiralis]